jgi:hypothetical protein
VELQGRIAEPGAEPERSAIADNRNPSRVVGHIENRGVRRRPVTEVEWLECNDPEKLLKFLSGNANDRKLRLYLCAVGRQIWHLLKDQRSRDAVEVAEWYADGLTDAKALDIAHRAACHAAHDQTGLPGMGESQIDAASAAWWAALTPQEDVWDEWTMTRDTILVSKGFRCCLLRDLFYPISFRPVKLSPIWLAENGGAVCQLAAAIYDDRAFDRLPILADALEDAGCTDRTFLEHLRCPGPHTRGCWALDLVLGKS